MMVVDLVVEEEHVVLMPWMLCFQGCIDKDEVKNPRLNIAFAWILHVDPLDRFLESLWYSYRTRKVDDAVVEKKKKKVVVVVVVLMVSYW